MTITEFLLARIAEDEAIARAAIEDDNGATEGFANQYAALVEPPSGVGLAQGGFGEAAARMISTYAVPARVQAECEAKRRIVGLFNFAPEADGSGGDVSAVDWALNAWIDTPDFRPNAVIQTLVEVARALASIYADHPDFREEWRVS